MYLTETIILTLLIGIAFLSMPKSYCDYYRLVVTKKKQTNNDWYDALNKTTEPVIRKIRFNKKKNRWELLKWDMWLHFKVMNHDWMQQKNLYLSHGYDMILIPYNIRQRTKETKLQGQALDLPGLNEQYFCNLSTSVSA